MKDGFFLTKQDIEAIIKLMKKYKTNEIIFSATTLQELRDDIDGIVFDDVDQSKVN